MRLQHLSLQGFRNLDPGTVDLDAPFVVLHGDNAQGKTNALEAVWWLASLKPLRTVRPAELARWGGDGFQVGGRVLRQGIVRQHRVDWAAGRRDASIDGKRCAAIGDWFTEIRAICFTPADGEIVSGGPELRRRWVDRAAFTARPAHLDVVRDHQRVLLHKAAVLRQDRPEAALLDTLDEQLAVTGARLAQRRAMLLTELAPHVGRMYSALATGDGRVELALRTTARGDHEPERADSLREMLARARPTELRRRRTLVGPQTDEVAVRLGGRPARRYGSRGQVRSLVLALKLAELQAAVDRGVVPLFLLDDLSSELDRARTARLVALLAELGAQVLATTTDPEPLDVLAPGTTRRIRVDGGRLEIDGGT